MDVHYVVVPEGGGRGRFGENRASKRTAVAAVVVGAAMALCLLVGAAMEERNMVVMAGAGTQELRQQALKALAGRLSQKEVNYEVARQAVEGLPVPTRVLAVKFAAQALSAGVSAAPAAQTLLECSNKDAYLQISTSFGELAANITARNASLFAREATLKAEADAADQAWLDAQSSYVQAISAKDAAKEAATYAAGMYSKYETAVSSGQAQMDAEKPKLDEEMAELPILEEVLKLITSLMGGGAAAKGNTQEILKQAQAKVAGLVPPAADKKLDSSIVRLKTVLQEADTAGTADKMAAVVQGLQAQMAARITEIGTQIQAMQAQLAADTAAKGEWEQKMVDLSDEHEKALNDASTADLTRNSLGGEYMVKDEAYQNFHSTFEEQVAQLSKG